MVNVLRISEAASLAMHAMVYLARLDEGERCSTKEMAKVLHASEHHLSKVLQRLARYGMVKSFRGIGGGFTLARPAQEISLLEVFEAIEGGLKLNDCLFVHKVCNGTSCIIGTLIEDHNRELLEHLRKSRLSELTGVYGVHS